MKQLPDGWDMTSVGDLSVDNCDGIIAPEFCSGLAVLSKYPIQEADFTAFDNSGDAFWDYEYFMRRGLGRVRIEPQLGVTSSLAQCSPLTSSNWSGDCGCLHHLPGLDGL